MAKIFLCHANEDKPQVQEVYYRLKAEGFEPWLDEEDLLPGQLWDQEIRRALKNSDFILIFFSQNSVAKRGYFQREMKLALETWEEIPEGQIYTIPARLDNCQIPDRFQQFQRVDLFAEGGFDRMVHAIRVGLGQRQQAKELSLSRFNQGPYQFQTLIEEKTAGFVGRAYVFEALNAFLQRESKGYFLLEGHPGMGKSAILANYVQQTKCIAHFKLVHMGPSGRANAWKISVPNLSPAIIYLTLPYRLVPHEMGPSSRSC